MDEKKVFGTILDRKEAYWDYEIIHLKNTQKFTFFHGFCQKVQISPFFVLMENGSMAIFPTFFFRKYRPEKGLLQYSRKKKRLSTLLKNKKIKKLKNWHFSKDVNPWFWSKNDHFSYFLFSGNKSHENVFYDILQRENAFLGYKNKKKFKNSKNWHFSKDVTPWFWSKNGHFSYFLY